MRVAGDGNDPEMTERVQKLYRERWERERLERAAQLMDLIGVDLSGDEPAFIFPAIDERDGSDP